MYSHACLPIHYCSNNCYLYRLSITQYTKLCTAILMCISIIKYTVYMPVFICIITIPYIMLLFCIRYALVTQSMQHIVYFIVLFAYITHYQSILYSYYNIRVCSVANMQFSILFTQLPQPNYVNTCIITALCNTYALLYYMQCLTGIDLAHTLNYAFISVLLHTHITVS